MARKTSSKPADSTANLGFEADSCPFLIRHSEFVISFALPGQLFYSTQIPVCLWFARKNNTLDSVNGTRLFDGETEFSLVA